MPQVAGGVAVAEPGIARATPPPPATGVIYDDAIVRMFFAASVLWGVVGMLVGVVVALQLAFWQANVGPYLTFGRLRPLHTNAVIFAFVGNMIFAGIYYSHPASAEDALGQRRPVAASTSGDGR